MNQYKCYYLIRVITTTVFGAFLGGAFLIAQPYAVEIFDILLIAMGLLTAVMNLPSCLYSLFHVRHRGEWINLVVSAVAVAFGVLLMLIRRDVILLVLGVMSFLLPFVRVILVEEKRKRLKREAPMILFGAFMVFVSLIELEETVFFWGGIFLLTLSVLYLLWGLLTLRIRLAVLGELEEERRELIRKQEQGEESIE